MQFVINLIVQVGQFTEKRRIALHVEIGKEGYFLSAEGILMPTRKDQPPPDLRYFKQMQKSEK